jgi:tagatose-1,6-bisphosphate aldolase non-catalytic subunit AgaZ/GatZ
MSLLVVQSKLIEVGSVTGAATQSMNCGCSPAAAALVAEGSAEVDSALEEGELWFSKVEALSILTSESTSPGGEHATIAKAAAAVRPKAEIRENFFMGIFLKSG